MVLAGPPGQREEKRRRLLARGFQEGEAMIERNLVALTAKGLAWKEG